MRLRNVFLDLAEKVRKENKTLKINKKNIKHDTS